MLDGMHTDSNISGLNSTHGDAQGQGVSKLRVHPESLGTVSEICSPQEILFFLFTFSFFF